MTRLIVLVVVLTLAAPALAQEVIYNPIGVTWDVCPYPDQVKEYIVYERTEIGVYEELAVCTPDTTRLDFTAATPHVDGVCSWVVTVVNKADIESERSTEATAVFVSTALPAPTGLVPIK